MGIYPQAFYASALIPIGSQHTDQLRPAIANAVLGQSISRNSAIAIQALPKLGDPQVVLIQNAFLMAHRFLFRANPATVEAFFRIAATHDGQAHHCRGPAASLNYYLGKLGWQINQEGWVQVSAHDQYHLLFTSRKLWKRLIQTEWEQHLLLNFCDRKNIHGLPPIDKVDTCAVLSTFPAKDIKCLVNEMAGAFQCRAQQATWDPSVTDQCLHCDSPDTRMHRVLECPAYHDLHGQIQNTFTWRG